MKMRKNSGLSSDQKQRLVELGLTPSAKTDGKGVDGDDDDDASTPKKAKATTKGDDEGEDDESKQKASESKPGDSSASSAPSQRLKQWEAKFEQLKEFQEKNGHCKTRIHGISPFPSFWILIRHLTPDYVISFVL